MRYQADSRQLGERTIAALEYAIANFGCTAELRASLPSLDFAPPIGWYELDAEAAHAAMASRVLLRTETPGASFVSNGVVQYFTLGQTDPVRLSDIDTTLDITALRNATVLDHVVDHDGYLAVDDGVYSATDTDLRVRRSQLAYVSARGDSSLAIFTATTPASAWDTTESEIKEMEDRWLTKTILHISGDS